MDSSRICVFPYIDWPTCTVPAADVLEPSYTILRCILAVLVLAGLIPVLLTLVKVRLGDRRRIHAHDVAIPARARPHCESVPALDRKGSLRARVLIALLCNAILTPDPLGLANILHSDLVEVSHAIAVLALLSVALSLAFRWVRVMLMLTDGLRQLNRVTRLYSAVQVLSIALWTFVTLIQVVSTRRAARVYKAIPLVYTAVTLLVVYASASVYSMLTLHRLSTSTQTSSTVSSQTLSRVQGMVHTLWTGSAVVLLMVVPLTIERLAAVLDRPVYPDLEVVVTLLDLLRIASLRLLCLSFAVGVAWVCMSNHVRDVDTDVKMDRAASIAASTTAEMQMAALKADVEAGGHECQRGVPDHDQGCIEEFHHSNHHRPNQPKRMESGFIRHLAA